MAVFIDVTPAPRDDTATDEKDDHYDQANEEFVHGKPSWRVGWSKGYMPFCARRVHVFHSVLKKGKNKKRVSGAAFSQGSHNLLLVKPHMIGYTTHNFLFAG